MESHDESPNVHHSASTAWEAFSEAERRALHAVIGDRSGTVNTNEMQERQRTPGQRIADGIARRMGSWPFIIVQSLILVAWIGFNTLGALNHWDPYPYILLNLALSFQAAYAAPIIMMSQNR